MRQLWQKAARARTSAGDLAFLGLFLSLLPGLGVTGLAVAGVLLWPSPADAVFPLFLLPLGLAVVGGGVVLLLAARELRRVAENQAAFVAQAAHELKNALAAVQLTAEALQRHHGDTGPAHSLQLSLAALQREVEKLLDWGRLAAGKRSYRLRPCFLEEVVAQARGRVEPLFQARGQRLEGRLPAEAVELVADREALASALVNLLTNASKYSPPGSPVLLQGDLGKGRVRLLIRDWGPGIPEAEQRKIFRMFYRAPGTAEEGVGLGLAIVTQVAEAHGGKVEVFSRAGEGALFVLTLPTRQALEG